MCFTTIRYWQKVAHDLSLYNGIQFTGCLTARNFEDLGSQQIGRDAIAAAFVRRTPEAMRALLLGQAKVLKSEPANGGWFVEVDTTERVTAWTMAHAEAKKHFGSRRFLCTARDNMYQSTGFWFFVR